MTSEQPSVEVPMADLRDALQRAHDGESPDSLMEDLQEALNLACPCLANGRCAGGHGG